MVIIQLGIRVVRYGITYLLIWKCQMGYHLLRNQYRNGLDHSVTVSGHSYAKYESDKHNGYWNITEKVKFGHFAAGCIVCGALWHVYNAIVYIIISFHS